VRACQELGEQDEAVALVFKVADDALRVGRWSIALDTLRLLPSAVRSEDADLLLAEAHALVQLGQPDPARQAALAALELGGREGRPHIQLTALIELANIARYCGDCTTAEEWLSSA